MKNEIKEAFDSIKVEEALIEATQKRMRETRKRKSNKKFRKIIVPIFSLALVGFLIFGSLKMYAKETAFIDIDVNPSVELKVNSFDRVVGAYAYNKDGQSVLKELDVENKKYTDAVKDLISTMTEQGYIDDNGLVSITLQNKNKKKQNSQLNYLKESVSNVLKQNKIKPTEEVFSVGYDTKVHSHKKNVSPAKYLAIQELQKYDSQSTIDECREHSLSDIRNQTIQHHKNGIEPHSNNESGNKTEDDHNFEEQLGERH